MKNLPIPVNEYLVLKKGTQQYLIDKDAFHSLIWHVPGKGKFLTLKKLFLSKIPMCILLKIFKTQVLGNGKLPKDACPACAVVVLPWNQKPSEKSTIFYFGNTDVNQTVVAKVAFSFRTAQMVRTEYEALLSLQKKPLYDILTPRVLQFEESANFAMLTTSYHVGGYLQDAIKLKGLSFLHSNCPKIPICSHPYFSDRVYLLRQLKLINSVLYANLMILLAGYRDSKIAVCFMHGDLTRSNVIESGTSGSAIIIDWEESTTRGIPIDILYFDFRLVFDKKKKFKIDTIDDVLVVFHYVTFLVAKENIGAVQKLQIESSYLCIAS